MIYRPATQDDVPQIMALVTEMVAGTAFSPPVEEKLRRLVANSYTELALMGDELVAFMCGIVCETFINHDRQAYDRGLFVAPAHRGTRTAVRLIRNFEAWARQRGASAVWLGQSVGHRVDDTLRFYQALGYECQGFNARKPL